MRKQEAQEGLHRSTGLLGKQEDLYLQLQLVDRNLHINHELEGCSPEHLCRLSYPQWRWHCDYCMLCISGGQKENVSNFNTLYLKNGNNLVKFDWNPPGIFWGDVAKNFDCYIAQWKERDTMAAIL